MEATQITSAELRIGERRRAVGLSAEKLARIVDCSAGYLRTVEHGYQPSDAMAARIDAALRSVEEQA